VTPTEILKNEHKVILLALNGAEREAKSIQDTGKVDVEKINQMVDFFRNFADKCHHAKEEKYLVPKMEERGISRESKPISFVLKEHVRGREKVKAIAEALPRAKKGDSSAIKSLKDNLSTYVQLLRGHIDREDNILFPMADRIFTPEDQQVLSAAFEKVEAEEMGEGIHEKYHQLAHDLAKGRDNDV